MLTGGRPAIGQQCMRGGANMVARRQNFLCTALVRQTNAACLSTLMPYVKELTNGEQALASGRQLVVHSGSDRRTALAVRSTALLFRRKPLVLLVRLT